VISLLDTWVPDPAVKLPPVADTSRPPAVWEVSTLDTVNVTVTLSDGATVVADSDKVLVTSGSVLVAWQEVQPVVEDPVWPDEWAKAAGISRSII
jgi:hypothetical protein